MKVFSILGTGWLGLALAKSLKNDFNIKVSIRDRKKEKLLTDEGFSPYLLNEKNVDYLDILLETDYLFINFPPSKFDDYLKFLEKIYSKISNSKIKIVFFISSTSIYPNENIVFDENSEINIPISKKVFDAEKIIEEKTDVIFRCSGLMGYDRIAGKYFAGKVLNSGGVKVNYIHRDDIIEATLFAIRNDLNGVFNLCSAIHPTRKEIYLKNAKKHDFEKPIFKENHEYGNRIIDGSKIERLGFRYKYPNPLEF